MGASATGYVYATKAAQFLRGSDELVYGEYVYEIKRVTFSARGVKVRLTDGREHTYAPGDQVTVRRPKQWIAPQHTGWSPGMPTHM